MKPETRNPILICPLNWGLGHASRDIPIIRKLLKENHRVIVAGDKFVLDYIISEFPDIETELLPGKKITYSKNNSQTLHLLRQLPSALIWMHREKKLVAKLLKKYNPDYIFSDNRYGVRHPKVRSILITHQLMLKLPKSISWLEKPVHLLIKRLVSRFDLCMIPDNDLLDSLAGDLVHKYPLPENARLIGPLSRFMDEYPNFQTDCKYDLLAIISGPEPQRTIFQQILTEKLLTENLNCLIVTGTLKDNSTSESLKNIKFVPHLESSQLAAYIKNIPLIISRAGYSTIMDLWCLKKDAILIPTPGQTEQEHLAQRSVLQNHIFLSQSEITSFNFQNLR